MKIKKRFILLSVLLAAVTVLAAMPPTKVVGDSTYQPYRIGSTSPVKLYAVTGYNSGPAQFVLIFQGGAAPTNGQTAVFTIPVQTGNYFSADFSYYGVDLDAVTVANSTTPTNYTAGVTNCSFQIIFQKP